MWWTREKTEISEFLYKILITDAPRGYARQVAQDMGVPYPTLSKYWLGKRRFPASLVKPLFHATKQDVRVAEFFVLDGSDYRIERASVATPAEDLPRAVMMLASLEAKVTDLYLSSTTPESEAGERLSPAETEAMRRAVQQLIVHAERLRAALA